MYPWSKEAEAVPRRDGKRLACAFPARAALKQLRNLPPKVANVALSPGPALQISAGWAFFQGPSNWCRGAVDGVAKTPRRTPALLQAPRDSCLRLHSFWAPRTSSSSLAQYRLECRSGAVPLARMIMCNRRISHIGAARVIRPIEQAAVSRGRIPDRSLSSSEPALRRTPVSETNEVSSQLRRAGDFPRPATPSWAPAER
jgi:hypothetical protein